jgi:hypothetical protein
VAVCLCRPCHRRFSGLTAFDRHLRWLKGPPWVSCRHPQDAGLVWSEARRQWATHTGDFSAAAAGGMPTHTDGGISPVSANCKASEAS